MIESYRMIGKIVKSREGFEFKTPAEKKKYLLLQYCSDLNSFRKTDKKTGTDTIGRLLVLHLDTKKGLSWFDMGEQLNSADYDKIMLFIKKAPGDPKIFAVTNSIYNILQFEMWKILDDKTFNRILWSDKTEAIGFKKYLDAMVTTFFEETQAGFILKKATLKKEQQSDFPIPNADVLYRGLIKSKYTELLRKQIDKYQTSALNGLTMGNQGYAIKIGGKFMNESSYGSSYLDLMHYYLMDKNYILSKRKGICHICHEEKNICTDVSLRHKFYGTTNPYYFDGLKNNRTFTAFSMCSSCDEDITIGTNEIKNRMGFHLLDISCYILPGVSLLNTDDAEVINKDNLNAIEQILSPRRDAKANIDNQVDKLQYLAKKTSSFDILFYHKDPKKQEFKILAYFRDVRFDNLITKTKGLQGLVKSSELYKIGNGIDLSLLGLRMLTIPSKRSHKIKSDGEYDVVGRQIVALVESYLYNRKMDYFTIIRSFTDIWSRIEYDNQPKYADHVIAAFILQLYISHLDKFNQIKGVRLMDTGNMITSLNSERHKEYIDYFEAHKCVYEKSPFYRGLFLLGTLIAEIERKQYLKTGNSAFSNRINYRGISPRKVLSIYDMVIEYCKIWDVYDDVELRSYCEEALLGINYSNLLPEEVVFYILSGKSYSSYRMIKHKQENQSIKEESNDKQ